MSDLVERLRGLYNEWNSPHSSPNGPPTGAGVMLEAAARIAQLEAALERIAYDSLNCVPFSVARAALEDKS